MKRGADAACLFVHTTRGRLGGAAAISLPMTDALDLPDELSAMDAFMHRGEAHPRTRMGTMGVSILDTTPDWDRYVYSFDQASQRLPRLRQKVVVPSLSIARPRWVVDPDFDINFHVRRVRVTAPGTLRQVFDLAEVELQSPLDVARPLWTATLVEGLPDGQAAHLLHMSHAVTDGVGALELLSRLYDPVRDATTNRSAPLPVSSNVSADDVTPADVRRYPGTTASGARRLRRTTARGVGRVVAQLTSVTRTVRYAQSGARVLNPPVVPSPLLRHRSAATRSEAIDINLADLRAAANATGGSVNDVYLAGLCGALRRYHIALDVSIDAMPMTVPVNYRGPTDRSWGNRTDPVTLAAPVGQADPERRIREIGSQMDRQLSEPAIHLPNAIASILGVLPTAVFKSLTGRMVARDLTASNVAFQANSYIAGAKILRQYGLGPLVGAAMTAVLMTWNQACTISVRYDRASVNDGALFTECLLAGFDEVLALGGPQADRSVPATFADSPTQVPPAQRSQTGRDHGRVDHQ
jgi:diacylglycerol O-acyltransferase / wax synthase